MVSTPGVEPPGDESDTRPPGSCGGSTPSRHTPPGPPPTNRWFDSRSALHRPSPFDAEEAPALLGSCFPDVEVVTWDGPLVRLTSREAVHDYLVGRLADPSTAWEAAGTVPVPLVVTKCGSLVFARKR